jgi:hypothetical protein
MKKSMSYLMTKNIHMSHDPFMTVIFLTYIFLSINCHNSYVVTLFSYVMT